MRALLLLFCSGLLASAQQTPSAFMKAWVDAFNKNDADALVACYDRSDDTNCLVSVGLWFKGFKEIENMYRQDMKEIHFYDSTSEGMKQRILGDVAVVAFIHQFKYLVRETGVRYQIHIRTTATLRKDKKSWKIVSEHSSPIQGIERARIIQKD